MTEKKSNESRRKLLKSIAAGSGAIVAGKSLPESWSRPVVDSVMLPVHAQTSPPPPPPPQLTYSCSVVGQSSIALLGIPLPGPIDYTVTNTGTGSLTGGFIAVGATSGTTGGLFTDQSATLPDPLLPGDTFIISLTNIRAPSCTIAGAGTIRVEFVSNETGCNQVVDVTCAPIP